MPEKAGKLSKMFFVMTKKLIHVVGFINKRVGSSAGSDIRGKLGTYFCRSFGVLFNP